MLVLTRKSTQVIKLGEDIVITVIRTSQGAVRLGIEAPSSIRVMRAESACSPPQEPKAA